jgi:hypothetical protein
LKDCASISTLQKALFRRTILGILRQTLLYLLYEPSHRYLQGDPPKWRNLPTSL